MAKLTLTREEYTQALIKAAKDIQGDDYAGDDYYNQSAWDGLYEDGDDPYDAVREDMGYWDYNGN